MDAARIIRKEARKHGIETLLVASGGTTYQVPLTYRAEPLDDELAVLVGTLEHSDLGTRYCYDAPTDPVYVAELVRVIREGDEDADIVPAGSEQPNEPTIDVVGSGVTAGVDAIGQVRLVRVLDRAHEDTRGARGLLVGTWTYEETEREDVLAVLR